MNRFRRFAASDERFSVGNRVTLLRDGPEAFPAMLEAIDAARRRVLLEMYWFEDDEVGRRFRDALVLAKARGVEVCVMYDAVGSLGLSSEFFSPLVDHAEVRVYNSLSPWRSRLSKLSRRDHRKLLVTDDVAFTGGMNLVARPWRDDAVRVQGPAVAELAACFAGVWASLDDSRRKRISLPAEVPLTVDPFGARVAVLPQATGRFSRAAFNAYVSRLMGARRQVWIANAYFLPNGRMTRALRHATLRGVDVRLLVPARSDVEIVRHASRRVWGRLLRAGARIFEFQPSILHSKTAVVDGEWATMGSFNLDSRSFESNLELNISVLDRDFAAIVEASFERDFEQSIEVNRRQFDYRSLTDRTLEKAAYWFRSWL
jgi:cardiolipin synthase A/B